LTGSFFFEDSEGFRFSTGTDCTFSGKMCVGNEQGKETIGPQARGLTDWLKKPPELDITVLATLGLDLPIKMARARRRGD
jgi:hypothetical protein